MRYVVIGAGAVGGTIGARLHQAGHDVVLVARGDHLAAIRQHGLRFVAPDVDEVLDVPAVGGPDELELDGDDVLLLATKSQHTADALGTWSAAQVATGPGAGRAAGEVLPVLCAQNGISNETAALRWFDRVAGVCVWLPAELPEPGTVLASCAPLTGMLHLGAHPADRRDDRLEAVLDAVAADLEGARFLAPRPAEVMPWKRSKLLSNLGNAFDALLERGGWDEPAGGRPGRGGGRLRRGRLGGHVRRGGGRGPGRPDAAAGDRRASADGWLDLPEPGPRRRLGGDRPPQRRDRAARPAARRPHAGEPGAAAAGRPRRPRPARAPQPHRGRRPRAGLRSEALLQGVFTRRAGGSRGSRAT